MGQPDNTQQQQCSNPPNRRELLFLTAILGECCLYQLHGLRVGRYNPFSLAIAQLKLTWDITISSNRKRKEIIQILQQLRTDNGLGIHPLYNSTIYSLTHKNNKHEEN